MSLKNRIRRSPLALAVGRWLLAGEHTRITTKAYRLGLVDSWLLHELDAALKHGTELRRRERTFDPFGLLH